MSGKICAVVDCHSSYRFLKLWTKTRCLEHVQQLHEDCPCLQPFSFRRFPKNPELRKEWLRVINRKDFLPTDNSVVCSKHFIDGSRIPQLEMGYETKVVVGHHQFAKTLAPLHKKRKTHNHNSWNGRHIGRTLDHFHTIMQFKKEKEEDSLVRKSEDLDAETTRRQLKAQKRAAKHLRRQQRQQQEQQQGTMGRGPVSPADVARTVQPDLPLSPFEEVFLFEAADMKLDPLDLELSDSLLDTMPDSPSFDRTSILDPLFDDTSQCSFYDGAVERAIAMGIDYDSLDLELRDSLLSSELDLGTAKTGGGDRLSSSFARAMSSLEAEMSETLEAGLRHVRGAAEEEPYAAGPPWLEEDTRGATEPSAYSLPETGEDALAGQPSTSTWCQSNEESRSEEPSRDFAIAGKTSDPRLMVPHIIINNNAVKSDPKSQPKTNVRFVCDACGKSYVVEANLRRHRAANHAAVLVPAPAPGRRDQPETHAVVRLDVKLLNCKICGERFQCADSFRSHLLKHMADSDKSYVL